MGRHQVSVWQAPTDLLVGTAAWRTLCRGVDVESPELLLLNELPFGEWISSRPAFDESAWTASAEAHDAGIAQLHELHAATIAGTRPRRTARGRVNEAFLWKSGHLEYSHTKQQFPEEPGYYEARWFVAGERHYRCASAGALRVGFLICTELMFNEHAREYGRAGAHVLLVPRAVGGASLSRWLVALRMAAIVSGCYVLSSNRAGAGRSGQEFGGPGWIIDPFGDVLAETSADRPVVSHIVDTAVVETAQSGYPCYVREWRGGAMSGAFRVLFTATTSWRASASSWATGRSGLNGSSPTARRRSVRPSSTFEWILEGAAIQDVFSGHVTNPPPVFPTTGIGTSIPMYDAKRDAWRVVRIAPAGAIVQTFVARQVGSEIILEGRTVDGAFPERWILSDITPGSFNWPAVESRDNGKSWLVQQKIWARRR